MDAARFLAGSPDRRRLLAHLREQPGSPRDVADALDTSRRSVQRNLAELRDRGWAERRDGGYHLTTAGALVAQAHADYRDALAVIDEAAPFLREVAAEHAPDPAWLGDAAVVTATAERPQAPVSHYVQRVRERETTTVRMLAPVLSRIFHEPHAELVLSGVDTELVLPADGVETARSMNPLEFRVVVRAIDLYRHDGPVPVGLTLGDDWVLAGAYDDDGQLRAVVECDHPELFDWAESLYEDHRSKSEPVRS
ncbi:helix-turn-helix transcriptional regulator [Halomicrococcus gelatinilyticus]|uniref:helix-turn-helix transcriptional regulator n=1 Tax=Halomicrococcus gelatinilyticus TaxID=1702103 RepID=UPI002E15CC99